jgi:MFS transporter, putative metabolite:H+ symporter
VISPKPTPFTPYQRRLFVFLGVATFFEGFDYMALSQTLPSLRKEFQLDESGGGILVSAIGIGAILAYFLIRKADRVGRRKILGITIAGYTICSLLSALGTDAYQFGAAQLLARLFLLAEYAVSMIYVAEEFPADRRGFAVGVIQGLNSLGAIACAGLMPLILRMPWGWRSTYLVGAVPLAILAFARRNARETARFEAERTHLSKQQSLFRIFRTPHAKRVPLLASIWALTYVCTYTVVTYWKEFAVAERSLSDAQVSLALMVAALVSLPLVFLSGRMLDKIGRRRGAVVIFCVASISTLVAYLAHDFWLLTLGLTGGIFASSACLPVLTTLTLELFPTELRADAYAWSNNLLGRIGYILGPLSVGYGAQRVGYGPAVACTAVFPLFALALILTQLPETSGKELEETSMMH